jgi:hypothetical protein
LRANYRKPLPDKGSSHETQRPVSPEGNTKVHARTEMGTGQRDAARWGAC